MDPAGTPVPIERLLAHRAWVRRVAGALVAGEADAEDLAQEAWVRALERGPREEGAAKGWFRTVLRRGARDLWRTEGRRERREEKAARPEAGGPSTEDLVAEAEVQRRVVNAVLDLEEPYRTTVVLRYFHELPLAEVARRQGVPLETVRTRVRRALDRLRARFDGEEGGDGRRWRSLLLPLARRGPRGPSIAAAGGSSLAAAAGVLAMAMKAKVAVGAVVLAAAGLGLWWALSGPTPGVDRGPAAARETASVPPAPPLPPPGAEATDDAEAAVPGLGGRTRIEVHVSDTSGRPVPGASVALHRDPPPPPEGVGGRIHPPVLGKPAAVAPTDGTGACAFPGVPAGSWLLGVRAEGFAAHHGLLLFSEGEEVAPVRVVLRAGCALGGLVTGTDGRPLPGVPVLAVRPWEGGDRGFNRVTSPTDGEGRYRLEGLEPGLHDLFVLLPGGVLRGGGCVQVPEVAVHDIALAGGASLRGRVVDDAGEEPVPGAAVALRVASHSSMEGWDGNRDAFAETESGPDGTFAFADLPPGTLGTLAVLAEGYLPYPDPRFDTTPTLRTVFSGGLEVAREVRLRRGVAIRGTVTGPDGKPVAGVRVSFGSFHSDRFQNMVGRVDCGEATTAADGTYRLPSVRPGVGMLDVRAEGLCLPGVTPEAWRDVASGSSGGSGAVVEVPLSGEVVRDLRLVGAASVEGICVDGDGVPVPGARVLLAGPESDGQALSLAARPGGDLNHPPLGPRKRDDVAVWLAPGGPGHAVSGVDGSFRLTGVRADVEVVAIAEGRGGRLGRSDTFRTEAGVPVKGLRITVERGSAVAGRIRRADGKPPVRPILQLIEGVRFREPYWGPQETMLRQRAPASPVSPDGTFRVEDLEPGWWTLQATDEGCALLPGPMVELQPGTTLEGVEILLPAERVLAGTVADEDGQAVAGAEFVVTTAAGSVRPRVILRPGEDGEPTRIEAPGNPEMLFQFGREVGTAGRTDAEGRFRKGGLEEGRYRIVLRAPGYAETVAEAEGGSDDLALVLRRERWISGRVVETGSGRPVAGLHVAAAPEPMPQGGWPYRDSSTAADGSFRIERLAPGRYTLSMGRGWSDRDTNCIRKEIPGVEAGTEDLAIEVDSGVPMEGRVVDEEGNPVTWGLRVTARLAEKPPDGSAWYGYDASVGPDGSFRMVTRPGVHEVTAAPEATLFGTAPFMPATRSPVPSGARDVVLTVRRGAAISGRVLVPGDLASSSSWHAPDIRFRATGEENAHSIPRQSVRMAIDGTRISYAFTTPMLEPGKAYDLMVPMFAWGPKRGGAIARGVLAGTTGVELVITEGGAISGTVVDGAGRPVGKVPVFAKAIRRSTGERVFPSEPGRGGVAYSEPDGTFTVGGLGDFVFRMSTGGAGSPFALADQPGEFVAGARDLRLVASPGCSLSGTLVDSDGRPAEWLYVQVLGPDGKATHSVMTSKEDGSFTIDGLPPGPVRLRAVHRGKDYDLGTAEAPATGLALRLPE